MTDATSCQIGRPIWTGLTRASITHSSALVKRSPQHKSAALQRVYTASTQDQQAAAEDLLASWPTATRTVLPLLRQLSSASITWLIQRRRDWTNGPFKGDETSPASPAPASRLRRKSPTVVFRHATRSKCDKHLSIQCYVVVSVHIDIPQVPGSSSKRKLHHFNPCIYVYLQLSFPQIHCSSSLAHLM
jgi:hypothetical protein